MNILLFQPPIRDFYQTAIRTQPLGLAYLAASLRREGHEAGILDCQVPGRRNRLPLPERFSYMRHFYTDGDLSPFKLYSTYYHFGLSEQEIMDSIRQAAPDAVGISCQFTPYINDSLAIASLAKAILPGVPVIMGGAHASVLPQSLLRHPDVDYVVLGEGEETLPRILSAVTAGTGFGDIPGIGFKDSTDVRINPRQTFIDDLDDLPWPARDLLDTTRYTIGGTPYTMLITSRGCPQNCSYCSVAGIMGKAFRPRSAENIIAEIRHCHDEHGISIFDIEDDNFTLDTGRALKVLGGIIDEFGENAIQLYAMNGLSLIALNSDLLQKMKKAGFQKLDLALGSSSASINTGMKRPADPRKSDAMLQQVAGHRFPATTYIILGIPGHTLENMLDCIVYLTPRATMLGPSIFYPSPGTELYNRLFSSGDIPSADFLSELRSSLFPIETPEFSRLDLVTLLRLVRWINYCKRDLAQHNRQEISFEQLSSTAFDQWWPGDVLHKKPTPEKPLFLSRTSPLTIHEAGQALTAFLLQWQGFYGIQRISQPNKDLYTYRIFPYNTSSRVMQMLSNCAESLHIAAAAVQKPARPFQTSSAEH